ncbi:MAG: hypothetical protein IRY94_20385, partial [Rhodospirillaceae bacterium]|nr:hypothetical protein [Rhodospirillaceae bacterium]
MSEAASAAAAAPADRDDEDRPFDVEAAADAIERLLGADGQGADGAGA